jgi:hypothetical protein
MVTEEGEFLQILYGSSREGSLQTQSRIKPVIWGGGGGGRWSNVGGLLYEMSGIRNLVNLMTFVKVICSTSFKYLQ